MIIRHSSIREKGKTRELADFSMMPTIYSNELKDLVMYMLTLGFPDYEDGDVPEMQVTRSILNMDIVQAHMKDSHFPDNYG